MLFLRLFKPFIVQFSWWLTTHEGFYSPCDEDHCVEIRNKARSI